MLTVHELEKGKKYKLIGYEHDRIYTITDGELCYYGSGVEHASFKTLKQFNAMRFEPYTEPYTPTEQEIQLFKLLPDWVKWVATDGHEKKLTWMFSDEPYKRDNAYDVPTFSKSDSLELFSHIITLKFEHGPYNIEQHR